MSAAIDRLLAIARAEGDTPSTERDEKGATYHSMPRPMSEALGEAGDNDPGLSYLQSAQAPATEGYCDEASDTTILFPMREGAAHVGPELARVARAKKPPALWLVILLGVAGVLQLLRGVFGDLSILRMAVGVALIAGAVMLWRQRAARSSRNP